MRQPCRPSCEGKGIYISVRPSTAGIRQHLFPHTLLGKDIFSRCCSLAGCHLTGPLPNFGKLTDLIGLPKGSSKKKMKICIRTCSFMYKHFATYHTKENPFQIAPQKASKVTPLGRKQDTQHVVCSMDQIKIEFKVHILGPKYSGL